MSEFLDDQSEQDLIQQMLDKIYPILNDKNGGFYLPTFVRNSKYDPYDLPVKWSWNLTDSNSIDTAGIICQDVAINDNTYPCTPATDSYILDPSVTVTLSLTDVVIAGLSNIFTQRPTVAADGVTVTQIVELSTLTPPPYPPPTTPSVTVGGNFVLTLNCCCSADKKTCVTGTSSQQTGTGTFLATIPNPKDTVKTPTMAALTFVIEQISPGVLTIKATNVAFTLPVNQDGNQSIFVDINITSTGEQESYNQLAENAFNSASGIQTLLTDVNQQLNTESALGQFSDVITNEIDGYLKQNHMYPFNSPSFAI
jgi:hypothetical protein